MRLYGNDVTLLPDEVVKSFSETQISQEGDTKWRSEAACLAFNTAVWWSSTSVKQVGVIHPLHLSSFQASPLLSSITSDGPEEPSSSQSRAAAGLNSWSQPTGVQACRRPGCTAL